MTRRVAWLLTKLAILWFGLLLCGFALWQTRQIGSDALSRIDAIAWLAVSLLLLLSWGLTVTAWRFYLLAYTNKLPAWSTAFRQVGLLLIGKYVPGGVFGFAARVYDEPDVQRRPLVWAGVAEQAVNLGMSMTAGGVLYLAATRLNPTWVWLLVLLPPLAIAGTSLLHLVGERLPWLRQYAVSRLPGWKRLLSATSLQLMQLLAWAALVAVLADQLHGVGGQASLGVAGAFLVAVAAGMFVVITPGGIGVREAILIGLTSPWLELSEAVFLAALLRLLSTLMDAFAGILAMTNRIDREAR